MKIHLVIEKINDDVVWEPCSFTDIDGTQRWFLNTKTLAKDLGIGEEDARRFLDSEDSVSLNYLNGEN